MTPAVLLANPHRLRHLPPRHTSSSAPAAAPVPASPAAAEERPGT